MFLKRIIVLTFSFLSVITAKNVSQDDALLVARNLFVERSGDSIDNFEIKNIDTIKEESQDIIYVFHLSPSGFILVSADDVGVPILGYSFENIFPMGQWPEPLTYLINTFKEEIILNSNNQIYSNQYVADQWSKYMGVIDETIDIRNVAPLMTARWNQDNPWNGQCPEDAMGPGGRVYAGCVAVSMVQIMYYWRFPNYGSGSHGYYSNYGYLSVDFSDQTYDYNQMSDNIGTDEAQKIMYHAGIGVEMGYSPDGSGAWVGYGNRNAMTVMRDHFFYDNSIAYVDKSSMSNNQYRNLIKNEIDNNRPLISRGCSNDGCHAWNLDGYEGDNIHSNFGWGGSSNGFYALSSMGGFSSSQGVVYNIIPSSLDGPNLAMESYELLESDGDFDNVLNPGETFELLIDISSLEPWNDASNVNLSLTSSDENISIVNNNYFINNLPSGSTASAIPFTLNLDDDTEIKIHHLELIVSAEGENDAYFEKAYDISFSVSLNQANFPFVGESQNGAEAGYTVEGSPIVIDINNDGIYEIFFGDYGGRIFGIDFNGDVLPGFPVFLPDAGNNQIWGAPAASDIDNDGVMEIVFTSKNSKCYVVDVYGNVEVEYDASQYLMGTPSIVEIDGDPFKEIVFGGYSSDGKVFAINHDGSDVENFPVEINQKMLRGFAIADFDVNGLSDMAIGTESGELFLVYDSGQKQSVLQVNDKFKSEPTILDNGEFLSVYIGNDNGILYRVVPGVNGYDELVTAESKIKSSVSVGVINNRSVLLFGSNDKYLYAIDGEGNSLDNWPVSLDSPAQSISSVFSDLDGDGINEIITGSSSEEIYVFHADGTPFTHFPMKVGNGITSTPIVLDGDMDGDLDIVFGTNLGIAIIDIKDKDGIDSDSWSMFRGNVERDGCRFFATTAQQGDLNEDNIVNILDVVILVDLVINNQINSGADLNMDGSVDVLDVVILVSNIING